MLFFGVMLFRGRLFKVLPALLVLAVESTGVRSDL